MPVNLQPLNGGARFSLVVAGSQIVEGYLAVQMTDAIKAAPNLINLGDIYSVVFVVDTQVHAQ
jgi:hypothetical protein